ncbi:hypothetical protein [Dongia sp.]|uniref:hypothetical protein n=1 Tax=Dongia sp. TaxID=1977262 RepID=UPI0035AFDC9A
MISADTSVISALGEADHDRLEAGPDKDRTDPGAQGTLLSLDPDLVLGMADANNALFVQGDAEDAVTLLGDWTKAAEAFVGDDGQIYDQFVGRTRDGSRVTLYVDRNVSTIS